MSHRYPIFAVYRIDSRVTRQSGGAQVLHQGNRAGLLILHRELARPDRLAIAVIVAASLVSVRHR
jgi:hypothetical protein